MQGDGQIETAGQGTRNEHTGITPEVITILHLVSKMSAGKRARQECELLSDLEGEIRTLFQAENSWREQSFAA